MIDTIIYIFIGIGFLTFVVMSFISVMRYKHIVIIKTITNGGLRTRIVKAKSFTDKKKKEWWMLQGVKDKIKKQQTVPPSEAIELNDKGKLVATMYEDAAGNTVWATDKTNSLGAEAKMNSLNSSQREVLINKIREAEERKNKKSWKENIIQIAGLGALLILVISLLVFYGEIAKPAIESHKLRVQELQLYNEMVDTMRGIEQKIEGMEGVSSEGSVTPPSEE